MAVLFVFVDGVGLGEAGGHNPFSQKQYDAFYYMSRNSSFDRQTDDVITDCHLFKGIDARLGVEGLPQSGTGQATLFSGVNASKIVGRHFGPYPHSEIKHLLKEESLFRKAQQQGKSCYFMNAYPDIFFEKMGRRNRWTCTTLMTREADIPLNREQDVRNGTAVTAELTQQAWKERLNIDLPRITPADAARRMLTMAEHKDLLLLEYYLTDKAGHAQDHAFAENVLEPLDQFLQTLIDELREGDTLVLTSDHGNIEDLSTKTHTLNEVPLFVYGNETTVFHDAESIKDVPLKILKIV